MSAEPAPVAAPGPEDLVPIHTVARRFGLNSSTLRYYESRGLLEPASRHAGRRWYGPREVRRIAIILFWQRGALMSLDEIAEILDRSAPGGPWQTTVSRHLADLRAQIEQLQRVETYVSQALECEHHECLDACPDYEQLIWDTLRLAPPDGGAGSAASRGLRPFR
jgi:DNA-binding transcriptional MerR regulator